jgi:E3 ubiquitin-protein ligase UHRF1
MYLFQINREMMELIETLQRKAVEEGKVASDDAEECGDGDSEENDGALVKGEDDSGLNEEDQDSADADANADGSVKIVVEIKEGGKDDKKSKMGATEVVDVLVDEDAAEQTKKRKVDEDAAKQTKKRKGDAETGTNGAKRMKSSAAVEEVAVCGTPVKRTMKSGDMDAEGNGSPAVSSGRRVTRSSSVNATGADDSPARRTRSRAGADAGR